MSEEVIEPNEEEVAQLMTMVIATRQRAYNQLLFGCAWWAGSSVAMYFALTSTGSSIYWYGGALAALFHWYRAFKLINITREAGITSLIQREKVIIGLILALVIFSTTKILPEYVRISSPGIGTCWKDSSGGMMSPVACWTAGTIYQTTGRADTAELCGTDFYLQPDATDSLYSCLEKK